MSTFIPIAPFPSVQFTTSTNTFPTFSASFGSLGTTLPIPLGKGYNGGHSPMDIGFNPIAPLPGLTGAGSYAMQFLLAAPFLVPLLAYALK